MFASHNTAKFTIFKRKMCKIFKYILHIHYRILYIIIPNVYTIILFYGLTTLISSLNLCTVGACGIFLLHAISVLVSSFGDNRFCISISSLQYLATPSIGNRISQTIHRHNPSIHSKIADKYNVQLTEFFFQPVLFVHSRVLQDQQ